MLEFLHEENVFNESDYIEYSKLMQGYLLQAIKRISYSEITYDEKISTFKKMRTNEVWSQSMDVDIGSLIIKFFKSEKYKTILFLYGVRKKMANVLHLIKK